MGLFKPDLYRSFAVGFALGAVVLFGTLDADTRDQIAGKIIPSAVAATVK